MRKKIGKSLEAKVVIALPEFDETGLEEMDVEYLADILIVSQADRMKSDIAEVRVDVAPRPGPEVRAVLEGAAHRGPGQQAPHPLPKMCKGRPRNRGGIK